MEFEIPRTTFADALALTQGVVERRNTLPILSNVLIEGRDSTISLLATDLDVGIRTTCPATVKGSGAMTVSARTLYEFTAKAGSDTIRLKTLDSGAVEFTSGRFKGRLPGLDPKEFPPVPGLTVKAAKGGGGMHAPASLLVEMIERTLFAVSLDETRFNLSGVYTEGFDGGLRMVATDGHRLALVDRKVDGELPKKGVILPRKGLAEVKKVLAKAGGDSEPVQFLLEGNVAKITCGAVELSMALVDGEFPDYRQVIPKQGKIVLSLARDEFLGALARVSVIANERARGVKLTLRTGSLELRTSNPDAGEASDEIEVEYSGAELSIGFNARYLAEVLSVVGAAEKIEFSLSDEASPGVLRAENDEKFTYVVMPMRL